MSIVVDLDQELEEVALEQEPEIKQEPEQPSFNVPDKFKNKSTEDIIKSYTELEREFGRKNNELGEMRSLADKLLQQELQRSAAPSDKKKVSFDDLVESPEETVSSIVDSRVKDMETRLEQINRQSALEKFQTKHPDYMEIGQDSKFMDWVQGSSYRAKQFKVANESYDFDAASELLSEWKERQSFLKQTVEKDVQEKVQRDLKKVTSESGNTGEASKKIYSRSQLMNLRLTNPQKFEAMQDEIERAYHEGRVR